MFFFLSLFSLLFLFPVIPWAFGGVTSSPANSLAHSLAGRFACQKGKACSQSKKVANNWGIVLPIATILHICLSVLLEFTRRIQMTHLRASHDTQQANSEFQKLSLSKRGKVQNRCCENEFNLWSNKDSFSCQRLCTCSSSESEAWGNSEMAYWTFHGKRKKPRCSWTRCHTPEI